MKGKPQLVLCSLWRGTYDWLIASIYCLLCLVSTIRLYILDTLPVRDRLSWNFDIEVSCHGRRSDSRVGKQGHARFP